MSSNSIVVNMLAMRWKETKSLKTWDQLVKQLEPFIEKVMRPLFTYNTTRSELYQDVVLEIYKILKAFNVNKGAFFTYLNASMKGRQVRMYQKLIASRHQEDLSEWPTEEDFSSEYTEHDNLVTMVSEGLQLLTKAESKLILEVYRDNSTYSDLGLLYGVSPSSICQRMKGAIKHLKEVVGVEAELDTVSA